MTTIIKEENMDEFRRRAAEQLREGKPLTGTDGLYTPLIKEVLKASLEGEPDSSKKKITESNLLNGHTYKNLNSSLGTFEISTYRVAFKMGKASFLIGKSSA